MPAPVARNRNQVSSLVEVFSFYSSFHLFVSLSMQYFSRNNYLNYCPVYCRGNICNCSVATFPLMFKHCECILKSEYSYYFAILHIDWTEISKVGFYRIYNRIWFASCFLRNEHKNANYATVLQFILALMCIYIANDYTNFTGLRSNVSFLRNAEMWDLKVYWNALLDPAAAFGCIIYLKEYFRWGNNYYNLHRLS